MVWIWQVRSCSWYRGWMLLDHGYWKIRTFLLFIIEARYPSLSFSLYYYDLTQNMLIIILGQNIQSDGNVANSKWVKIIGGNYASTSPVPAAWSNYELPAFALQGLASFPLFLAVCCSNLLSFAFCIPSPLAKFVFASFHILPFFPQIFPPHWHEYLPEEVLGAATDH